MHTNVSVLAKHDLIPTAMEFPELEVPVLSGPQRQGDVLVIPTKARKSGEPIGGGVVVVRAETNQSNTHTLVGDGIWAPNTATVEGLVEGWVTVPEGGEAFLIHTEEHNALGIGPGTYEVRRQREYAGEWRMVAD